MTFDELKQVVVASANALRMVLDGSFEQVRLWVEATEVVYAVWQDAAEPGGVGMMLIKGEQTLREILAADRPRSLNIIGIPCAEAEQAEALRQVAGEQDRRH